MAIVDELVTILGTKLSPTALSGLQKYGKGVENIKAGVLKMDKALANVRRRLVPLGAALTAGAAAGGLLVKSVVDQVSALDGLDAKLAETKRAERAKKALKEIVSKDDIKRVTQYRDSVEGLNLTIRGMTTRIVLDALPALQGLIDRGDRWLKQNKEIIRHNISGFFQGAADGASSLVKALDKIGAKAKEALGDIDIGLDAKDIGKTLATGAPAGLAVLMVPLIAKFGALSLAAFGAAAALEDVINYMNDEPSALGDAIDYLNQEFPELIDLAGKAKTRLGEVWGAVATPKPTRAEEPKQPKFGEIVTNKIADFMADNFGMPADIARLIDGYWQGVAVDLADIFEPATPGKPKTGAEDVRGALTAPFKSKQPEIATISRKIDPKEYMLPSSQSVPTAGGTVSIDESETKNSHNKFDYHDYKQVSITVTAPDAPAAGAAVEGAIRNQTMQMTVPGGMGDGLT